MIAALARPTSQWEEGKTSELNFWERFLETQGWLWKDDYRERLNPAQPLQDYITALLPPNQTHVSILDVGAGPLTKLGKLWPGHTVTLRAVDPLAAEYASALAQHSLTVPLVTEPGEAEHLTDAFAPNSFDLVHCINALDHSYDPLSGILQMLDVVKPGGYVVLEHAANEAVKQNYEGLHQWNFCNNRGDFIVWNVAFCININAVLYGKAEITLPPLEQPDEWISVRIRKHAAS